MANDNQYIVIPQKEITIDTLCKTEGKITISKPVILSSPEECTLFYNTNIMKIGKTTRNANITLKVENITIPSSLHDLSLFEEQLPEIPKITPNFDNYKTNLQHISEQLISLKTQRRLKSATEITYSVLTYLGWISLGLITLYTFHKIGLFKLCKKLVPKNLCFKLCCNEVQINNTHTSGNNRSTEPTVIYHIEPNNEEQPPSQYEENSIPLKLTPLRQTKARKINF